MCEYSGKKTLLKDKKVTEDKDSNEKKEDQNEKTNKYKDINKYTYQDLHKYWIEIRAHTIHNVIGDILKG